MNKVKKMKIPDSSSSEFNPAGEKYHDQDIYSRQLGYPPFAKPPEAANAKGKGSPDRKASRLPGYPDKKGLNANRLQDRKVSYPSDLSDRKIYQPNIRDRKLSYPTGRPERNINQQSMFQDVEREVCYPPGVPERKAYPPGPLDRKMPFPAKPQERKIPYPPGHPQDRKISYPPGHHHPDRKIPYPPGHHHQNRKIPYPPGHNHHHQERKIPYAPAHQQDRKMSYPPFPASKPQDFPERKFSYPQFPITDSSDFPDRSAAYPSFYVSQAPDFPDRSAAFQFESSSSENNNDSNFYNKQQLYPPPPDLDPYPRNAIDWKKLSYFHNTSFSDHEGSDVSEEEDSEGEKTDTSEENENGNTNLNGNTIPEVKIEDEEEEEDTEEKKDDSNEKDEEKIEEWNKHKEGSYEPEETYNEVDMDFSVQLEEFTEKMTNQKTLPKEKTEMANKLSESVALVNRPTLLKNLPQLVPLITSIAAENNFTTGISILNTINVFTHRFKDLGSPDCDLTWLVRRLCTFASESRPSLRNEGFIVLKNVISGFGIEYVLQPFVYILNDSFVKGGPRIKSIAIDALSYCLLVFDNEYFDFSLLSEWACKMLWNKKRRVRQASLELITLIDHQIGTEEAMKYFTMYTERPMESSTQSESETVQEDSSLDAIKARIARHSIPAISFTVMVDYGLYVPFDLIVKKNATTEETDGAAQPTKAENKNEISLGADVDWILKGKGPLVRSTVDIHNVEKEFNLDEGTADIEQPDQFLNHPKHYNSSSASTNSIRGNSSLPQLYSRKEIRHFEPSFQQNFKVYPRDSRLNKYEENSTPSSIANGSSDSKEIKVYRRGPHYKIFDESSTPSSMQSSVIGGREVKGYRRDNLRDIYEENSTPSTITNGSSDSKEIKVYRRGSHYKIFDESSTPSSMQSSDRGAREIKGYRRNTLNDIYEENSTPSTMIQHSTPDSQELKLLRRNNRYKVFDDIPTSSTTDQPTSDSREFHIIRRDSRYKNYDETSTPSTLQPSMNDKRDFSYRRDPRHNKWDNPSPSSTDQPTSDSRDVKVYRKSSRYNNDEVPSSSTTDQPTSDPRDFKSYRLDPIYNNLKPSPPLQSTADSRESRELRDLQELREFRDYRKSREVFEPRELRDPREIQDLQQLRKFREFRESQELQELRELREARDLRELQELRELRQFREPRETQEFRELRELSRNFKNSFETIPSIDDQGTPPKDLFSYRKPELAKMHQQANRQQRPDDHNDIKLRNVSSGSSETSDKVSDEFLRNLKVTEYAAIPIPTTKKIKERKEKKLPKKKKKKKVPEEKAAEEEIETTPLQKGVAKLNSTNWEVNMEGFSNMTEMIGTEEMKVELSLVNKTALRHLTNLRTQVCRVACAFYGDLFKAYGTAMESDCEKILQKLLEKTSDVNKFIREDATAAVMEACDAVSFYEMFTCLENLGVKHRNPLVRATTARMIKHLVTKHGLEHSLDLADRLLPILFKFLLEGSLEIRTHAKETLAQLMDDITFNEKMKKFVTPDLRRATLKQINAIRKSCNIVSFE